MCSGTGRAGTVCPWPLRFYSWLKLKCSDRLQLHKRGKKKKNSPPQSMSLLTLLLLTFSKLGGCASYYAHISVILRSACVFSYCSVCVACCLLMLAKITALPPEAQIILQHRHKVPACMCCLLALMKVCHSDSTASSFLPWLTFLLRDDSGISLWGWQCSVRILELASDEFSWYWQ